MSINHDEILKKVNPIYFSAKGCLGLLAETGDVDIKNFYGGIDKERLISFDMSDPVTESRVISLEARYHMWNAIAKDTDCQTIVDLPCGYLPHSLIAARLNKNYYGFDLPIVTEEIAPVAAKYLSDAEKNFVKYHGIDATNYESLRNALKDVHGKICIITDGFLGYFKFHDLKAICANVHRLLREFGGCWYTSDSQFTDLMALTYVVLTGGDRDYIWNLNDSGRNKVAHTDSSNGAIFMEGTLDERRRFLKECGFSVQSFRYPEKLKFIPSLKDKPDLMKKMLAAYQEIEEWLITADDTAAENLPSNLDAEKPFAQEFSLSDNVLSINLRGRLDTITAPKLLEKYEEQSGFTEIHIDATELSYISYAGLRTFKIMQESLKDADLFKIRNANDEVRKILSENGYKVMRN